MKNCIVKVAIILMVGLFIITGMVLTKKSCEKDDKVAVGRYVDLETGETLMITFTDDNGNIFVIDGDSDELNATWETLNN